MPVAVADTEAVPVVFVVGIVSSSMSRFVFDDPDVGVVVLPLFILVVLKRLSSFGVMVNAAVEDMFKSVQIPVPMYISECLCGDKVVLPSVGLKVLE